jgi:hypothetical protein
MKSIWLFLFFGGFTFYKTYGQAIQAGYYEDGLYVALDSSTNQLTAYYENYTGWDETLKAPRFSCVFFIQGKINNAAIEISTYYPNEQQLIKGQLEIIAPNKLSIKLQEEQGGCWNVEHFTVEPVKFQLNEAANWKEIKYVIKDKAYFYKSKSRVSKEKAYVVKNNFICIEKIEKPWVYGTYFGKKVKHAWLLLEDLNP